MKDYILFVAPSMPVSKRLLNNPIFQAAASQMTIIPVNDEYTRRQLVAADAATVPRLHISTEDGHLQIRGYADILVFLQDTFAAVPIKPPAPTRFFKPQQIQQTQQTQQPNEFDRGFDMNTKYAPQFDDTVVTKKIDVVNPWRASESISTA